MPHSSLHIDSVATIAQRTANSVATAAASLDRCSVPNRDVEDGLAADEMEYGMGEYDPRNRPIIVRIY